jgi:alpha-tubulin suppressor-like RCC1 family protein
VFATGLSNVVDVTAGYGHSCALKADGTIFCWGDGGNGRLGQGNTNDYNYAVQVAGITTATDVSAGYIHTCAVLADTTARCWGSEP